MHLCSNNDGDNIAGLAESDYSQQREIHFEEEIDSVPQFENDGNEEIDGTAETAAMFGDSHNPNVLVPVYQQPIICMPTANNWCAAYNSFSSSSSSSSISNNCTPMSYTTLPYCYYTSYGPHYCYSSFDANCDHDDDDDQHHPPNGSV